MEVPGKLTNREARVAAIWRGNGRLTSTIWAYLLWVRRFELAAGDAGPQDGSLTLAEVEKFAGVYSQRRGTDRVNTLHGARTALHAWSRGLESAGCSVPDWGEPEDRHAPLPALLSEYADFRRQHRGVSEATIDLDQRALEQGRRLSVSSS